MLKNEQEQMKFMNFYFVSFAAPIYVERSLVVWYEKECKLLAICDENEFEENA